MRSFLFVPGDSAKKMDKGLSSAADCLFIDLKDSVSSSNKETARRIASDFLRSARERSDRPFLYVRVNALDSGQIDDDLSAIMNSKPDGIVLPKSTGATDVRRIGTLMERHEVEHEVGKTRVIVIATETASSIFQMGSYVGASERLNGLTWGAEDLSADIGAERSRGPDGFYTDPFRIARSLALFAAHAAQVQAIDTVYPQFRDEHGFRRECEAARGDGFTGKMAIHPAQVAIINEVFTPSEADIERFKEIVASFERQPDVGVVGIDGQMYDRPHLERARRVLARIAIHPD